ncbi:hypothetical protein GGI12_006183, partial [Dipsacomyces acuminosporus]
MTAAENSVRQLQAQGLIFDLDGTLISTLEITEKVYTAYAEQFSINPAPILAFCHGVPTYEVLRKFFPAETHTDEYAKEMELEAAALLDGLHTIPGASELMNAIPRDKWAIFTSGQKFLAQPRLVHLKLPIPDVFLTPADVTNGKPHPEGYIKAARELGFEPSQCIVFEDAAAGVHAGVDSGATVVGLRTLLDADKLKQA